MPLSIANTRARLQKFEFAGMFIEELGWSNPKSRTPVKTQANNIAYTRTPVAQLSGVIAFEISTGNGIPDSKTRATIHKHVTEEHVENLLIFLDAARTQSLWYWVKREAGKTFVRDHLYIKGQPGDLFIGKLAAMSVAISELDAEGNIPITDVVSRLKAALDVERVTKKFYDLFQKEHAAFLKSFANCIPVKTDAEWYASVMLNRLMFVYFIQHKGFLDGDHDYLRTRLSLVRKQEGKDKFHSFYRYFLIKLFHEGLGGKKRPPELEKLIGKIPYLNGGMFDVHELEKPERYGKVIEIPDAAFERIFDYFDKYDWVLDPQRTVKKAGDKEEINPDVLGYIFEKYINQKQMGAYYTKEDITDYIGKNTIIPFLFDATRKECSVAFENASGPTVWDLLRPNPDDYIYPAVKKGVETPLPKNIEAGIKDVAKRDGWNKSATGDLALPTEIWREVVARRQRHDEIKKKLAAGEVRSINDLITLNLDIRRFAQDVIANCEGPDLLRALWHAIQRVTILDPTCGSGAFLFAALNILEPLYEGCLDRMAGFLADETLKHDTAKLKFTPHGYALLPDEKFADFARTLEHVANHVSPQYYIYKSIILQNLYGVDIMPEAVEICKLRLFLKLAAQVEPDARKENLGVEPLPDIDFNICAGNTLVGYATLAEVQNSMFGRNYLERIQKADQQIRKFRERQSQSSDIAEQREDKQQIRSLLNEIRDKMDLSLFTESGAKELLAWKKSHQPFHWYVEFNHIIQNGGFNVIVGNPPYAEIPKDLNRPLLRNTFRSALEKWSRDEDLYTLVVERSLHLIAQKNGQFGMILPLSVTFSTKRPFVSLRQVMAEETGLWHWSHFDRIPSSLFGNEVRTRCTVSLLTRNSTTNNFGAATTSLLRWNAEFREHLFTTIHYAKLSSDIEVGIPKVATQIQADALAKLLKAKSPLLYNLTNSIPFSDLADAAPRFPEPCVFIGGTAYNWFPAWRDIPETTNMDGKPSLPARTAGFRFGSEEDANIAFSFLCSSMGYWWWAVASDGFNLKKWLLERFPVSISLIPKEKRKTLANLGAELRRELKKNYVYKDNKGRIGNFFLPGCEKEIVAIDNYLATVVPGLSGEFFEDIRGFNSCFSRAEIAEDNEEEES